MTNTHLKNKPSGFTIRLVLSLGLVVGIAFVPLVSFAKKKTVRKIQEVDFGEMSLKGTIRNPEGAYLVQKRGIKFMPLHEVQKDMDRKLRESVQYVR